MWSCIPWHSWLDFRFQWCFYCHTYKVQTHSETLFLQCPVEYCHTQCATTVFLISTAKDNLEGDKFNGDVRGMFPSPTTPNLKRHLSMFSRDASGPADLLQHLVSYFTFGNGLHYAQMNEIWTYKRRSGGRNRLRKCIPQWHQVMSNESGSKAAFSGELTDIIGMDEINFSPPWDCHFYCINSQLNTNLIKYPSEATCSTSVDQFSKHIV